MKKNTRVIQISGIRGILMVVFVGACLAAGFVAFPGLVAMKLWNYLSNFVAVPFINMFQGVMLWGILAITGFIVNDRRKFLVSFKTPSELSDEELKKLMERVKLQTQAQALNSMVLKSSEVKAFDDNNIEDEIKEETHSEKESEKEKV